VSFYERQTNNFDNFNTNNDSGVRAHKNSKVNWLITYTVEYRGY